MRAQEDSLRKLNGGHSEGITEERIDQLERKNQLQTAGLGLTFILFLAGALIMGIHFKEVLLALVAAAAGICLLQSGKEDLDEEIKEKETSLSNLMEEYQEIEDYTYLPIAEEIEIDSLNLAMSTIQKLAGQNDPELAEDQN